MKPQHLIREINYSVVNFAPLEHLLGDALCEQYMFMATYKTYNLGGHVVINAYKHDVTRNYLYIDNSGNFYKMVKSRHNKDEDAFEMLDKREGICKLISNAIANEKASTLKY